MELLIFYLTNSQRHYTFPHFIQMLSSSHMKSSWKILVLTHDNDIDFYYNHMINLEINFEICKVNPNNNYLTKVFSATDYAEKNGFKFMMKCDNDIFLKSQTLDYMIDNLNMLNNDKHLTLGPVLTSGIPGIEYFIEEFLDNDAKSKIENMFLKTKFRDCCGADYTFLNKYTEESTIWDKTEFFNSVKNMNHYYKGIHPIRVNDESLRFLNDYIIENKERFLKDNDLKIINDNNSPYLCNSIFCIKTDIYRKIITNKDLYVDSFDEVPVNKYSWLNNMNHLFVENGFAIHMYYNWNTNHIKLENEFCDKFFT